LSRRVLYFALLLSATIIVILLVAEWFASGQSWIGFSSNSLVVAIVGGLIVGIPLLIVTLLATPPVTVTAFRAEKVNAQFGSLGILPPESQQARRSEIEQGWTRLRSQLRFLRLSSEFRSQLRGGDDVSIYLWTKTIFGRIESGTMLTGLTGDLIFSIRASAGFSHTFSPGLGGDDSSNGLVIYLPPGFIVPGTESVSSTSAAQPVVRIIKTSIIDRYAPGWTIVFLSQLGNGSGSTITITGVTAPNIAGRYFFKIARVSASVCRLVRAGVPVDFSALDEQSLSFIPTDNWPSLFVKGEVDPARITGTLRHAASDARLSLTPIAEAGKVWAYMTMRIDPYTGQRRQDLPTIGGQAYVNAKAKGHYELEGLAPGIYDIYASASGYPERLCGSDITVLKGQSLHLDCYLQPGPVIHGMVFSKNYRKDGAWAASLYVRIELYNAPTLSFIPDPSSNLVSWSPEDSEQSPLRGTRGPQDVGSPQRWFVRGGNVRPFLFEFGVKDEYGAPKDMDGMVPQLYATWVNGLTSGRYDVRAWVLGYVQSTEDGSTFLEHYFDVIPNQTGAERDITIELHKSRVANY
jgi:hypothetical protein